MRQKGFLDAGSGSPAHVKNRGHGRVRQGLPVYILRQLALSGVPGDEADRLGVIAVGEETPSREAMALAAVMPGTISTGMFSASSAAISSPARPKSSDRRISAALPFAGLGKADHHVVNIFLLAAFPAAAFANQHALRLPPRQFQHLG